MEKALNAIKLCLMASVTVMCLAVGVKVWNVGTEMEITLTKIQTTVSAADTLVAQYATDLGSDKNRKAIEAGIAAAASWQATARLVNTTTIPALNRALGELENSGRQLAVLVEEQNGNATIVGRDLHSTIGAAERTIAGANASIDKLGQQVEEIGGATTLLLSTANARLDEFANSSKEIMGNVAATSTSLHNISAQLEEASRSAPGIAKGIEKVASKAPWYQKMAAYGGLLVGIGSLVWR